MSGWESGEQAIPVSGPNRTAGRRFSVLATANSPGFPTPPVRTPAVALRSRPLPLLSGQTLTGLPSARGSLSARYHPWRCFRIAGAFGSSDRVAFPAVTGATAFALGHAAPDLTHLTRSASS